MKHFILLLLLTPIIVFAQENSDLPTQKAMLDWKSAINSLSFNKETTNIYNSSPERYTSIIVKEDSKSNDIQNILYVQNKNSIDEMLRNIYYPIINIAPVCFATINEKDTCLIIGSYVFDKIFNTARTTDKDRAKIVVTETISPICNLIYSNLKNTNFKYIILQVSYKKKNLIDSFDIGSVCTLSSVLNLDALKSFSELDISEDELIEKSTFYIYEDSTLKKIKISE